MTRTAVKIPPKSQGGYSLVEIVVSLGILSAVLVAIASMFVLGQSSVNSGRKLTEATSLAQHIMEDINKLSYDGLQSSFGGSTILTNLQFYTADTRVSGSYAETPSRWQLPRPCSPAPPPTLHPPSNSPISPWTPTRPASSSTVSTLPTRLALASPEPVT